MTTETLNRDQAIKRIQDIMRHNQVDHIHKLWFTSMNLPPELRGSARSGAANELMAIFDIKEEEL